MIWSAQIRTIVYDSSGTRFEFAHGLTEFSGVTLILGASPASEPVEFYSLGSQAVEERALFGEISCDLGERWRVTAGGRWFGYCIETGSITEFPYTLMSNSPFTDFASDDRGVLVKANVSYRFDDQTRAYFTRSEGYRIGGGNHFPVCTDQEIALLTNADPGNDRPRSGCIYEDQVLIRPDTTNNYELGLRRPCPNGPFTACGTLFHVDWTDIQVAGETPFRAQPFTPNGGAAVSRNVELASAAGVRNALRLRGTCSDTHAELSQDSPGLLDGGAALELLDGYAYIGDVLTRTGLRACGETLPAYDLHNLSAAVSKGDRTLSFYADNLIDEYAVTHVRQTPGQTGRTEEASARAATSTTCSPRAGWARASGTISAWL